MPKNYGYARVSTKEQNEERQVIALLEQGVPRRDILIDKQSGKDFNRPKYKRLLTKIKPGDTLFIKSIDRLGRNYEEIIAEWRYITRELGVFIVVLDMPLLDTRQKEQDITGVFIAELVLQILSYFAEMEREFIHRRQEEGIEAAKARGVRFGRPPQKRPAEFTSLCKLWRNQQISARLAAKQLGIHHRTFMLWAKETASPATLNG